MSMQYKIYNKNYVQIILKKNNYGSFYKNLCPNTHNYFTMMIFSVLYVWLMIDIHPCMTL